MASATFPLAPRARPIVTLTVNPALDISTSTAQVITDHKMRCGSSRIDPGGGGVNVARTIQSLGGDALAIYAAGGLTGATYRQLLEAENVPSLVVPIAGTTRESFTVDEGASGAQFRFVLQGPEFTEAEWRRCLAALEEAIVPGGYVVASGSLPPGVPADFYAQVARLAHQRGARSIIDTSGEALTAALAEGVYLVKPSLRELSELVGRELTTEQSEVDAAAELVARGSAQLVALTLGDQGAVLASTAGVIRLPVPHVQVQSAVGAGDAFLGAFVWRLSQGRDPESAFRSAVCAGSATAAKPATEMCAIAEVEALEKLLPVATRYEL
ncbi:1-phosphofructokinase family hexose kinase [Salinibacterium sp. UTAS2018]|uniref:1-phosphofructokinase family hexose kinase n=1 Tax=Salinibacterium sp. UTAS2018 TaxID=2508880 RepID=UPI0010096E5C|nr:1-phosphofructokinase family hexose kinase [Salinibacterium sp. UTAS2018]QAV70771.1 1-phosphofructokinase family hexose kinase [Salinibacterium sp. UTAS2018]